MNQLQHINIGLLHHHPKNPRADLGELTELAESIKARGIMQNLTVVPRPGEDGYWVVIGNRRLEASKLAGLESLPCIVADMDDKEQMSTMLLENMQRSDLTVYEQAQGFQMMMDLGMTAEEIGEKTGFSESTVRRRVKLCQFDREGVKKASDSGVTLMDFMALSKVEDENVRSEILTTSSDAAEFRRRSEVEYRRQETQKTIDLITPKLQAFAQALDYRERFSAKYTSCKRWDLPRALEEFVEPEDSGKVKYFYYISSYDVTLYKCAPKQEMTDEERARKEKEKRRKQGERGIKAVTKENFQRRQQFVEHFASTPTLLKKLQGEVITAALKQRSYSGDLESYHNWETDLFRTLLNLPREENRDRSESMLEECHRRKIPEGRALLAWMLCGGIYKESADDGYFNSLAKHRKSSTLDSIYDLLTSVGYEMSADEIAMQDGSHECFKWEDE